LTANAIVMSNASAASRVYNVSSGSGFSAGSNLSQFATMKISAGAFDVKAETAGVTTLKGAMAVMDIAETAITNLDQIRADIGSVQNQVTSTINNITVTQVNVKAAESQIRDVDFAAESANYSKANILAQSGSYAMAQANSVQQNVLRLLQ
ncbi:flagellin, partial [Campylobacter jejuni]|nr:flagellin [Campylobacter jejuni]